MQGELHSATPRAISILAFASYSLIANHNDETKDVTCNV